MMSNHPIFSQFLTLKFCIMFGGWNSTFSKKNTLQSICDNDKDITEDQPPRKRQKKASRRNGPAHGRKQVSVSQREQLSRFFDEHDDSTQTKVSRKDSSGFNLQESSTNCQNNLLTNTAGEKGDVSLLRCCVLMKEVKKYITLRRCL